MPNMKLINVGEPAMRAVAEVLKTAKTYVAMGSSMGPVQLKPGTVWSGNRMLVQASPMVVYATIDDRLYEWSTAAFVQEEWLAAMSKGMKSAEMWCEIAQVEVALICGLFVPWYLLLGMSCAKVGLFYAGNKQSVDKAIDSAPKAINLLLRMKKKYPTLFKKLTANTTREIVSELKQGHGVTAEDVAFFLGRVVHGVTEAPEVTIGMIIKITSKVGFLVTLSHAPGIVAHAAGSALHKRADELRSYLNSIGYTVTLDEAKEILREVASDPEALHNMKELETSLKALLPALETLGKAYGAS